jgi:hypothetical protein
MPKHINTFDGGLDLDTNFNGYSNKHYPHALNMRIFNDSANSSSTLVNMLDTTPSVLIPTGYKVVGVTSLRDNAILMLKALSGPNCYIAKVSFEELAIEALPEITLVIGPKAFDFRNDVQVVARYETNTVQKIYWVDGAEGVSNKIRFANLADPNINFKELKDFELVSEVKLSSPTLDSIVTGTLKAGTYQYAYCLYKLNGSETAYSSATVPIPISLSSLTEATSKDFKGSNPEEISNKGVRISLQGLDTTFDRVRVVRLFYSTQNTVPEVEIVFEGALSENMFVVDSGGVTLGTLIIEDYRYFPLIISASTIETKNDFLFVGNTKEEFFTVNFDARAYRYSIFQGANKARVYLEDSSYWDIPTSSGGYYPSYYTSAGVFVSQNFTAWQIPENDTVLNKYNLINLNESYLYQSNLTTIGGEGKNIKYEFYLKTSALNDSASDLFVSTGNYNDFSNPVLLQESLGYQRDDIYRFGIVFYDKYGRQSFTKWIGDIRFPSEAENGNYNVVYNNLIHHLGIKFTLTAAGISTLNAQGVVAWQIVRAERTYQDATVKDCGYVGSLVTFDNANRFRTTLRYDTSSNPSNTVLEYACLETLVNKNNTVKYDRLDYIPSTHVFSRKNTNSTITPTIAVSKYSISGVNTIVPRSTTSITSVGLFKASKEAKNTTLAGISIRNAMYPWAMTNTSQNLCVKGTTLVLKIVTPPSSVGTKYVRRRSFVYPYGGYTTGAIKSTIYYPTSQLNLINSTPMEVWGGDCYIGWFEYMRGLWSNDSSVIPPSSASTSYPRRSAQVAYILTESKINTKYIVNDKWSNLDDGVIKSYGKDELATPPYNYNAMWETRGVHSFNSTENYEQAFDLYTYNPVYSQMDKSKVFFAEPLDFNTTNKVDVRVYRTGNKINGEPSDTWTKILPNNFLDVDTRHGSLTRLYNFKDRLFFFQQSGLGIISVQERETVSSQQGNATTIGVGGVMDRKDYISTVDGISTTKDVMHSNRALYFIDSLNKKLCRVGESVEYLSDLKGLKSFCKSKGFTHTSLIFNKDHNEIWWNIDASTVVFNEYVDAFNTFTSDRFLYAINANNRTIIYNPDTRIFTKLDEPGKYRNAELTIVANPNNVIVNRYDSITLGTHVLVGEVDQNKAFTNIKLVNQHQISEEMLFTDLSRRRFRNWIFNKMRDNLSNRLFDSYLKVELSFDKAADTEQIKVYDMLTNFTPINAR